MLTDVQVIQLRQDEQYKEATRLGLKKFATDLVKSGQGDLRPDVTFLIKVAHALYKARVIGQEMHSCSRDFLERILNLSMKPRNRTVDMVKDSCDEKSNHYIWMRYDVERVQALFGRCKQLLSEAQVRSLLKTYSTITQDKDLRLLEIIAELELLLENTVLSINMKHIFRGYVDITADQYYKKHEEELKKKFLGASQGGFLGMLPEGPREGNNEKS